jgi:phage/plasmid-associated DNA primase
LNHSSAIRYQKVQAEIKDAMVILATGGDVMQIYRMYIEMIAFFLLALAVMAIPAMG